MSATFDAGAIEATLTLDRSPFVRDLKAAREQARRFAKEPVKVPITADRTKLTQELKNAREQIRRLTSQKFAVNIQTDIDTTAAEANLDRFKARAENTIKDVTMNVDAKTVKAQAKLMKLKETANRLDHDTVTIKAKADTSQATGRLSLLQSQMLAANSGSSLLIGTITGAGPAMVPVLAAAAGAAGTLASALAAAGAGAAVVGASVVGNFMKMKEQTDLVTKAQKKLRDATNAKDRKAAVQELAQAKRHLAGLPGPINHAANAFLGMQRAWNNFLKATQGPAFRMITRGLNMVSSLMPRLVPIFNAFSGVVFKAMNAFQRWMNGPAFRKFLNFITRVGPPALSGFIKVGFNLARMFINILEAFAPLTGGLVRGLVRMTGAWARWSAGLSKSSGFQQFLQLVRDLAPVVVQFIENLVRAVGNLVVALLPVGRVVLKALNGILKFIAGMDPHVLAGIVTAILGVVTAISLLNGVVGFITGAVGSVIKAFGLISMAVRGLGTAFTFLAANPVVAVIAAIAALGIALYLAYKKSETFRNFVNGVFAAVKKYALVVAQWFAGPFVQFFKDAWSAIQGAWNSAVSWFQGVWDGIKNTASSVGNSFVNAWNTAVSGVKTAWGGLKSAWHAVVNAISGAYHTVVDPVINAFQSAWGAVSSFFRMMWRNYWSPVFQLFGAIVKTVFGTVWKYWMAFLKAEWTGVSIVFRAVYNRVIKPTINGFASAIRWLVNNVAKPLWHAMQAAWNGVGRLVRATYDHVIKPTINAFGSVIRWLVNNVAKPLWRTLTNAWSTFANTLHRVWNTVIHATINAVAGAFRWLVNTVAKPLWNGMKKAWSDLGDGLKWVYNHTIKPVIDFFSRHIKDVRKAFHDTVDGIRTAWNQLEGIAKKPIKFVIGTVLNKGLIAGFNKLAGVFGTDKMDTIPMPFATGGRIPGFSPTPTADNVPIMATADEFMVRRNSAKKMAKNEPGVLEWINETGTLPPMYGIGGWISGALNTVQGAFNSAVGWGKNLVNAVNPVNIIKKVVGGLIDKVGGTAFANLAKGGAHKILDNAVNWAKGLFAGIGGGPAMKGPHITGGYRWLEAFVKSHIPGAVVTSDVRPGAMTIYGTPSAHGLGLAVDWGAPMKAIWDLLYPLRGRLHELLGPWGMFRNGAVYRDPTLQAMHENHVHAATFAMGGWIKKLLGNAPVWDQGGIAGPGYNLFYNGTGGQEHLAPVNELARQNDRVARILEQVLVELRKDKQVALTPDGRRSFEAVLEDATHKVNVATTRKAYLGRKDN